MDYHFLSTIITVALAIFIVRVFFSPKGIKRTPDEYSKNNDLSKSKKIQSFIAMSYYGLILNRSYKVIISEKYLIGLHIGNAIGSPYGKVGSEWQDPEYYVNPSLENKYSTIDFESESILKMDRANFRILRSNIKDVSYLPQKWGMGNVPYSGRLIMKTKDGQKKELILLGKQDFNKIKQQITPS